ncbi:MAG: class I SAM-dependent methyltransferase [Acidobacteriota bacterium]
MPRISLPELEDQPWLPGWLRDYTTDCLRFLFGRFVDRTLLDDQLAGLLAATGDDEILDLCSGGAGPLLVLLERLEARGCRPRVVLSDLYPNLPAFAAAAASSPRVTYRAEPLDARRVPSEPAGVRTMFSALHHFDPSTARSILRDTSVSGRGFAAFEVAERRLGTLAVVLGLLPLGVLAMTPFLRPFRLRRLIFTYVVPLVPLIVVWDGLASCCRSYSVDELRQLVDGLEIDGYCWQIGRAPVRGLPVYTTYLLGVPRSPSTHSAGESPRAPSTYPPLPAT